MQIVGFPMRRLKYVILGGTVLGNHVFELIYSLSVLVANKLSNKILNSDEREQCFHTLSNYMPDIFSCLVKKQNW